MSDLHPMTSIAELLDRVRRAEGPDRELDALLLRALAPDWLVKRGLMELTASVDSALSLVERKLPGWTWRVASCSVSDDAWVCPDFNHPTYGADFLARFNDAFGGRYPAEAIIEVTDVDRRPAGQPALALIESLLLALELLNPEVKHDAR